MANLSTDLSNSERGTPAMVQADSFSSWARLERVVSYCLRLIKKISRKLDREEHHSLFDMLVDTERLGPITPTR